jgi:Mycothiol maleylpyruvate isomerase N-terminal domain
MYKAIVAPASAPSQNFGLAGDQNAGDLRRDDQPAARQEHRAQRSPPPRPGQSLEPLTCRFTGGAYGSFCAEHSIPAPQELLEIERARWHEFRGLVDRIPSDRMEDPTLNADGWSVKDVLWHVRCWNTVVADELQRIQAGSSEDFD